MEVTCGSSGLNHSPALKTLNIPKIQQKSFVILPPSNKHSQYFGSHTCDILMLMVFSINENILYTHFYCPDLPHGKCRDIKQSLCCIK